MKKITINYKVELYIRLSWMSKSGKALYSYDINQVSAAFKLLSNQVMTLLLL